MVVGSEAALAARILRLANSAFLNPTGEPVNDLRIALTRLGVQLTRCTAVSFALQQMKLGGGDAALRPELQELWRSGALVASIAYVLARESRAANPDEALVAGLMHNIGKLYITVSAPRGQSAAGGEAWAEAVREWHPAIAVFDSETLEVCAGHHCGRGQPEHGEPRRARRRGPYRHPDGCDGTGALCL